MKAMFMVLRGAVLVLIGLVLWTLVGANWLINKSEDKALGIMKSLSSIVSKYFRTAKRYVTNFTINFEVFAESFYGDAVVKASHVYEDLKTGFKIRKEILDETKALDEENEVIIYYPVSNT